MTPTPHNRSTAQTRRRPGTETGSGLDRHWQALHYRATLDSLADGHAPTEVRLFKAGENDTLKGTFQFTQRSAELILKAAADWGNDYHFDYEHAALAANTDGAPAAGWYQLEIRTTDAGPELWAVNIRWTNRALEMIEAKELRYISPAFYASKGEITSFINCAVTNLPATKHMDALIAAAALFDSDSLSIDDVIRDALEQLRPGWSHLADGWVVEIYTDALVIQEETGDRTYHVGIAVEDGAVRITSDPVEVTREWVPTPPPEGDTMDPETLTLLGITSAEQAPEAIQALATRAAAADALMALVPEGQDALGTITAWRDGAGRVEALAQQVADLQAQADTNRLNDLLELATSEGRITPAQREQLTAAFTTDAGLNLPALESYLAATPRMTALTGSPRERSSGAPAGSVVTAAGKAWGELTNMEKHELRLENPEEFQRLLEEHRSTAN